MCESIGDNPNRRFSHTGVASGDFAGNSGPSSPGGKRFDLSTVLLYAILAMVAEPDDPHRVAAAALE